MFRVPLAGGPGHGVAVGPVAVNVHAVSTAVPPLLFTTVFCNVNVGATSLLVITHVAFSPGPNVTDVAVDTAAPVHTHPDAV